MAVDPYAESAITDAMTRSTMGEDRPAIPGPMKREIRQRCGFGCVICGQPLYHYDHMVEYAEVQEHETENITLLCARHHDEKTRGFLNRDDIVQANDAPYNTANATTSPWNLPFRGDGAEFDLAGNIFAVDALPEGAAFFGLVVDGWVLFGARRQDGQLLINMQLFDEFNILKFLIVENELIMRADSWDIEVEGTTITVRYALRNIFMRMRFSQQRIAIDRGRILCNGVELLLDKDGILETGGNNRLKGCGSNNVQAALVIGNVDLPCSTAWRWNFVDRYIRRAP